jgi:hypothetical protein
MRSKYIIRLDDASKNMKLENWILLQNIFTKYNIKPIIAVVPDNKDLGIFFNDDIEDFWSIVKKWQILGWNIAMHGHTHEITTNNGFSYCKFNKYGEFGGLNFDLQKNKIRESINLFNKNGINVDIWVAPAHNFDSNTLNALFENTDIRIISDGIAIDTYFDGRFYWIPQQLWRFKFSILGIRTICLHPNEMTVFDIQKFEESLVKNLNHIISFTDLNFSKFNKNIIDYLYTIFFQTKRKFVKILLNYLK